MQDKIKDKFDIVLLVGGLGTRLQSLIRNQAKCMAPIAGQPFLSYLLSSLSSAEKLNKVLLAVGHAKEEIIDWVNLNSALYPFQIDFVEECKPLGTGGAIKLALSKVKTDNVCVMNGDTFFDINFDDFFLKHLESDFDVSIALKKKYNFDRYGEVEIENNLIRLFKEKKNCKQGLINGGIYMINTQSDLLEIGKERFSFETEILETKTDLGIIGGFIHEGYFIDIGIPSDYDKADKYFQKYPDFNIVNLMDIDVSKYDTLFLDRDGVINALRSNDYVKKWLEFDFKNGILDLLSEWNQKFKHIIVITNQRGVGRGIMTHEDLEDIHLRMIEVVEKHGGRIDKIFYCTAVEDDDINRKPNTGMFDQACNLFPEIDVKSSIMIGDSDSDMLFAERLGMDKIKV